MDIKLKARLSAYSRFPQKTKECDAEVVTKEDIDSLFGDTSSTPSVENSNCSSDIVSFNDIDSLFD